MQGELTITVENARGLKDCDWFKRQDPYVEITCAGERKRTSTHRRGGKCPHWNEKLTFQLHQETHLVARVLDEDRHLLGRVRGDDEVGSATLDLVLARQRHGKRMIVPVYRKGKQRGTLSFLIEFRPNSSSRDTAGSSSCCYCNGSSTNVSWSQDSSRYGSICSSRDNAVQEDAVSNSSTCCCNYGSSSSRNSSGMQSSSSSRGIDKQEHIIASIGQGPVLHSEPWTSHASSSSRHHLQLDVVDQQHDQVDRSPSYEPQKGHSMISSSNRQSMDSDTITVDQQDQNAGLLSTQPEPCSTRDLPSSSEEAAAAAAAAAGRYPTVGYCSDKIPCEAPAPAVGWGELPSLQAMLDLLGNTDLDHIQSDTLVQGSGHSSTSSSSSGGSSCDQITSNDISGAADLAIGRSLGQGSGGCSSSSSSSSHQLTGKHKSSFSSSGGISAGLQHDLSSSSCDMDVGYLSYLIAQDSGDLLLLPAAAAVVPPHALPGCETQVVQQVQQQQQCSSNAGTAVEQQSEHASEPAAVPAPTVIAAVDADVTAAEAAAQAATAMAIDAAAAASAAAAQAAEALAIDAPPPPATAATSSAAATPAAVVPVAAPAVAGSAADGNSKTTNTQPAEGMVRTAQTLAPAVPQPRAAAAAVKLQPPAAAEAPAPKAQPAAPAAAATKAQSSPSPRPPGPPPPPPPLGPLKLVGPRPPPQAPKVGSSNPGPDTLGVKRFGDVVAMWQQLQREKNGLGRGASRTATQNQNKGSGEGGHAQVVDAIKQNSKYHAAVLADFEARCGDIKQWADEVRHYKASSMSDLATFIDCMESQLNTLKDERQELKMFGEWPEKKYDTLRDALAQYRYLERLKSQIDDWSPAARATCQAVLAELQKRLYDISCKMLTYTTGEDVMEKRFKSEDVPWPGKALGDSVRVASLKYGRAYLTATIQEVQRLKSLQPPPRDLQQKQKQLLEGAVAYTFRLHSFVSGLDAETHALFKQVAELLMQLKAEQQLQAEEEDTKGQSAQQQPQLLRSDVAGSKDQGAGGVVVEVRAS